MTMGITPTEAQRLRRLELSKLPLERRLSSREAGLVIAEIESWLHTSPFHDASRHEGPDKAADALMTYCPECNCLTLLHQIRDRVERELS